MEQENRIDRYVSFTGIDADGNSRKLIKLLLGHIDDPQKNNRFWDLFREKLARVGLPEENSGRLLDELYLIHANINNIRELFEEYEDHQALELLEKIEVESC